MPCPYTTQHPFITVEWDMQSVTFSAVDTTSPVVTTEADSSVDTTAVVITDEYELLTKFVHVPILNS